MINRLTLLITRLLRNIFIANIRWVVRSRQRTTLPKVPRPRIFKYSKSLICFKKNTGTDGKFSKFRLLISYWTSGENLIH